MASGAMGRREVRMAELWTIDSLADRFVEAARTARRLPRVGVQGYASTWPIVILPDDAYPDPVRVYRLPPPSPRDVEQMLEVMRWVQLLEQDERHLVWMRAKRYDWVEISKRFACDRTTAWRRWKRDLQIVAGRERRLGSGPLEAGDGRTQSRRLRSGLAGFQRQGDRGTFER